MKKTGLVIITILLSLTSFAQKIEYVYLDPKDSASNMYAIIYPPEIPWKGFMFLMPGFGESPQYVLSQTNIPKYAAEQGILTVIPVFKTGVQYMGADTATQASFIEIVKHVTDRYKLIDAKFFVGGFSIGGTCAVKYAELAIQNNYPYKPSAVFAIDPPLDFERFYNAEKRSVRLSKTTVPNKEALYMVDRIQTEMGGTPEKAIKNYYQFSPYSAGDTTQSAIKPLISTPVMFISEPDINWWLKERGFDVYNMNVIDCAAIVNELTRLGNKNAVLVTTENKGYRQPAMRHPHSWSIADEKQVVNWLLSAYDK